MYGITHNGRDALLQALSDIVFATGINFFNRG
ncbi:hypothetical protein N040_14995 [Serratia marcescens EGD-HP20]|nr:hypothetical protein N040_14995 [Serratia marcescens EGD-HP20]